MNDNQIPYVVYESALTRMDRVNKRAWILCIILSIMLVLTNLAWVIRESQFTDEYISIEAEQETDGGGDNIVVGGDYGNTTENQSNH